MSQNIWQEKVKWGRGQLWKEGKHGVSDRERNWFNLSAMAEIERFRIVDALFIIGSIITFIADQATGGLSKNIQISQNI